MPIPLPKFPRRSRFNKQRVIPAKALLALGPLLAGTGVAGILAAAKWGKRKATDALPERPYDQEIDGGIDIPPIPVPTSGEPDVSPQAAPGELGDGMAPDR